MNEKTITKREIDILYFQTLTKIYEKFYELAGLGCEIIQEDSYSKRFLLSLDKVHSFCKQQLEESF